MNVKHWSQTHTTWLTPASWIWSVFAFFVNGPAVPLLGGLRLAVILVVHSRFAKKFAQFLIMTSTFCVEGSQLHAADGPQLAIFAMNADGTELRHVVQAPDRRWHSSPSWSSDGKQLLFHAYVKDTETADSHVFVVQDDGSNLQDLGQGCYAAWSRDNKQIIFCIAEKNPEKEQVGVWIMNADGKGRQWVCTGWSPVFAPDGSRILYVSKHEGTQSIYVYDMLEGTSKKILQEPYQKEQGSARWSPDSKKVAFVDERNGHGELILIDAGGSEKEQSVRHRGNIGGPIAWAPNTKVVLWTKERQQSDPQRLQTIADQGDDGPEMLPNQDVGTLNFDPAWSPDNKRLVFVSDRSK